MAMAGLCSACKGGLEPPYVWPSDKGDVCQECWEQQCSESWWRMIEVLGPMLEEEADA